MHGLLREKVCIVTGAARGIGKEIAILFAEERATVIINDAREGAADEWIAEHPLKEQLIARYFPLRRRLYWWIMRGITSFPVPLSPQIRTGKS